MQILPGEIDAQASAPPTFNPLLYFPAKKSICTDLSGGRWRRVRVCACVYCVCVCARVCVRARARAG
jgi:hypothetical protein